MAEPTDVAEIKRQSVRGGAVTMASQGASVAIQLTFRSCSHGLLGPEEYGVMG